MAIGDMPQPWTERLKRQRPSYDELVRRVEVLEIRLRVLEDEAAPAAKGTFPSIQDISYHGQLGHCARCRSWFPYFYVHACQAKQ